MFAGGRVSQHGPLRTGAEATRRTWQASSARKQGRSGPLHFVTVRTEISQGGQVVITEEQDLVYRERRPPTPRPRRPWIRRRRLMPRRRRSPAARRRPRLAGRGEPGPALPVLRADLQRAPHPLRPGLRPRRGVSRPARARPAAGPAHGRTGPARARPRCDYSYRLVAPLFDGQGLIVSASAEADAVRVRARDSAGCTTATGVISRQPAPVPE